MLIKKVKVLYGGWGWIMARRLRGAYLPLSLFHFVSWARASVDEVEHGVRRMEGMLLCVSREPDFLMGQQMAPG